MNSAKLDRPLARETEVAHRLLTDISPTLETMYDLAAGTDDHTAFMVDFSKTITEKIAATNTTISDAFSLKFKACNTNPLSFDATITYGQEKPKTYRFFITAGQIGFKQMA